jgi:predicted nucleic acid-binding protein
MNPRGFGQKKCLKMLLVDTNIFLEVLLLQEKKDQCESFLNQLKKGKKIGVITDFSIHSIIVIMNSLDRLKELRIFLLSLTAYKGLKVYRTSLTDEINAVDIALTQKLDMDDALQYSTARALNVEAIISFDRHFNNLDIPRKEPLNL